MLADEIPVAAPHLRVVRSTCAELYVGVKEHHVVGRLERGRREFWARGKLRTGKPGSLLLMQPGDVHRDVAIDGPVTFQLVVLPADAFAQARDEGKLVVHPLLDPGDARGLPFHRLHDAVAAGADRLALEVATTEAVAAFFALRGAPPDLTRPVRRAQQYLQDRLGEAITLDELAAHAGLDKFHLCRAFRSQVGMPPHAYLTHLRIARAKQLLTSGVRASEVAPRVGLYDQSQLNRHFRRIVGTTPARYGNTRP